MFDRVLEIFTRNSPRQAQTIDENQLVPLAAAMALLEVAWADHQLDPVELEFVKNSLISLYNIDEAYADQVISLASKKRQTTTSMYPFTRQLNEQLTLNEKIHLMTHLWHMNSVDNSSFHYEEVVIRKLADLLHLRHSEFIHAKLAAKEMNQKSH